MAKILIVEDNPFIGALLARLLGVHETRVVLSGTEALNVFKTEGAALVVTDVELPDLSGLEVLRAVRRHGTVPVIVVTAGGEDEHGDYIDQARNLGAAAILQKPVQRQALLDAVEKALGV